MTWIHERLLYIFLWKLDVDEIPKSDVLKSPCWSSVLIFGGGVKEKGDIRDPFRRWGKGKFKGCNAGNKIWASSPKIYEKHVLKFPVFSSGFSEKALPLRELHRKLSSCFSLLWEETGINIICYSYFFLYYWWLKYLVLLHILLILVYLTSL